jgi:hypothetical protein
MRIAEPTKINLPLTLHSHSRDKPRIKLQPEKPKHIRRQLLTLTKHPKLREAEKGPWLSTSHSTEPFHPARTPVMNSTAAHDSEEG